MVAVDGIDLDLLLEDLAYTKKRVSELEDNQETIVKFLRVRFPKFANQLKKLLQESKTPIKSSKPTTAFGQEDSGLTTEEAVAQCMVAIPVSVDPVLKKVGIVCEKEKPAIPASLGG